MQASSYRCSACHGDEDWGPGHPLRGPLKSRSLSAHRSWPGARGSGTGLLGLWGRSGRQEVVLAGMASQRALPADPPMPILTVEAEVWRCRPVWPQALDT